MAQHDHANSNDTMPRPDDAIAMLKADHRQVRALFQQYEDTPEPYLKQIIAEHVFAELILHMLLEEMVFYPAVAEQVDEKEKRLVHDALQDHQQVRALIVTLQDTDDDATFEARFHTLWDHIDQHMEEEETILFPKAQQALAAHLEEITILLQERREQILAS
jgi:iron-sulfur cluster repair protein YtfE (RIC family)